MADNGGNGGTPFLAFLVGGLLVAVVAVGFFVYTGHNNSGTSVNVPSHLSFNVKPASPPSHP
jgi:hypothetical protein